MICRHRTVDTRFLLLFGISIYLQACDVLFGTPKDAGIGIPDDIFATHTVTVSRHVDMLDLAPDFRAVAAEISSMGELASRLDNIGGVTDTQCCVEFEAVEVGDRGFDTYGTPMDLLHLVTSSEEAIDVMILAQGTFALVDNLAGCAMNARYDEHTGCAMLGTAGHAALVGVNRAQIYLHEFGHAQGLDHVAQTADTCSANSSISYMCAHDDGTRASQSVFQPEQCNILRQPYIDPGRVETTFLLQCN